MLWNGLQAPRSGTKHFSHPVSKIFTKGVTEQEVQRRPPQHQS